ncbi:hypothetical protein HHK36_004601 [Tetracentron sinense]|uniref:ENTH domain-containing protein n=1 Tax=Tetracentron sinense TaxID=13715 RepID=A0A835A091_TETSI|nr:hypothetical protein HHK36_004601 [Tetracentron sinense]
MVVDVQRKLRLAIGSVKDHASMGKALIYNHDGFSDIEIAVVRATGHDDSPIDDKYMHEILFLVSNSPGSVPFLAERISHRLERTRDGIVALKTLVLVHRLLRGGDRYFEQDLRGAHLSGHLQMNTRWFPRNSDRSFCFLHSYVAFLEERMGWVINQGGKLEPIMCQGLEFRFYEEKSIDMAFRRLPKCQVFLDRVLDCSPSNILPSDRLARAAMSNILKESFQVYTSFCEGVTTLINLFFDFTNPTRILACDILKRASRQSYELSELYKNCKRIIENKNLEYPAVEIIAADHISAMEQFLSGTPRSLSSCPSPILKGLVAKQRDAQAGETNSGPSTLFSSSMETKISKVWVVFDEEEPQESHISISDGNGAPSAEGRRRNVEIERGKPCSSYYYNPFTTYVDTKQGRN